MRELSSKAESFFLLKNRLELDQKFRALDSSPREWVPHDIDPSEQSRQLIYVVDSFLSRVSDSTRSSQGDNG